MRTLPQQQETEIYLSEGGNLCIKQMDWVDTQTEHLIIITPSNIEQFILHCQCVFDGEDIENGAD